MKAVILAGLMLLCAAPAWALDCKRAVTQGDMNACAAQSFNKADAALNAAYKQLMAKLDKADQASLKKAQRAWLQYRDLQCAFNASGSEGGTVHPMVVAGCREALTKAQTAVLKAQNQCEEGDLGCTH